MSAQTPESKPVSEMRPDIKPPCIIVLFEEGFAVKVCYDETQITTPFGTRYIFKRGTPIVYGITPDLIVDEETYTEAYDELVNAWKTAITGIPSISETSVKLALRSIGIAVDAEPIAILVSQF